MPSEAVCWHFDADISRTWQPLTDVPNAIPTEVPSGRDDIITTFVMPQDGLPFLTSAHWQRLWDASRTPGFERPLPWASEAKFAETLLLFQRQLQALGRLPVVLRVSVSPLGEALLHLRPVPESMTHRLLSCVHHRQAPYLKHSDYCQEERLLSNAWERGYTECLRLTSEGMMSEAIYGNVLFKHQNGFWVTPHPQQDNCLPGIMRNYCLALLREAGEDVRECSIPYAWLESGHLTHGVYTNAVRRAEVILAVDTHPLVNCLDPLFSF